MKNLIIYISIIGAISLASCSRYVPSESMESEGSLYTIKAAEQGSDNDFVVEYQ